MFVKEDQTLELFTVSQSSIYFFLLLRSFLPVSILLFPLDLLLKVNLLPLSSLFETHSV